MSIQYAQIHPENISWARERAQLNTTVLAKKLKITEKKLISWESGDGKVTFKQAKALADVLLIPFGYLFLEKVQNKTLSIPDLRTLANQGVHKPSVELIKIVQLIQEQQSWYKDYLLRQGFDVPLNIRIFNANSSIIEIVADMRRELSVDVEHRKGNWEDFFRLLVKKIEDLGILVVRQGNLGSVNQPLSVAEFRGFALFDPIAPFIFINQADALSARLFTLVHELAHIWIGQSGVSDASVHADRKEEVLCNAVAAEFLVPANSFIQLWKESGQWQANLADLKAYFHVSTWVLARRALTLNLINDSDYNQYINKIKEDYKNREKSKGGPTYYVTKKSQLSEHLSHAVVAEALSGRMLLRDAGQLLGIKPHNIARFSKEFNA